MPENENITTYPEEPTNPSGYEGFNKSVYYILSLLRYMYYSKVESENKFYTKNGGTITGSVTIQGNLVVNGQSYSIDTENLKVGDYTITLAKDNEQTLTSMVGMVVPKYDGTNYGFFGWDADGYAYVGDLTNYDGSSAITLANNSSLQRISTIDTTNTVVASNGVIYVYDATNHCFKKPTNDNKYYVIRNGAFVETELFTEQKSKNIDNALYHLGAFDSADGKTRQTGVITQVNAVDKGYDSARHILWFEVKPLLPTEQPSEAIVNLAGYDYVLGSGWAELENHSGNCFQVRESSGQLFVSFKNTSFTGVNDITEFIIQYKLATPYTEQVIEGESILPLDSNMAQMIRQDVVEALNLLPPSCYRKGNNIESNGTLGTYGGGTYSSYYKVPVKPNATYCASSNGNVIKSTSLGVATYDINGNFIAYVEWTASVGTTASNVYFISFDFYTDSTNIMLTKSNHPYPYEPYHANKHITDEEATLLKQEEKKCRNLFDEVVKLGTLSASGDADESSATRLMTSNYLKVEPNTIYSFNNQYIARINFYNSTKSFISTMIYSNQSITTPSNCYYLRFDLSGDYGTTYNHNIMLNEGTHSYPYEPPYGAIVHKVDIEPVLLWENDNPESAFSNQTISISGLTNYRYLAIEYRITTSNYHAIQIEKVRYTGTTKNVFLQLVDSGNTIYHRTLQIQPTAVEFDKGKTNTTEENSVIIPIAIYGTNVL